VRRGLIVLLLITLGWASSAWAAEPRPAFRRGFNLLDPFMWPVAAGGAFAADPFPLAAGIGQRFRFAELARTGFDHVRLVVNAGPFLAAEGPRRAALIERVLGVAGEIQRGGLGVVVAVLAPFSRGDSPDPAALLDGLDGPRFSAFAGLLGELAGALGAADAGDVALELLNEPQEPCRVRRGLDWADYQSALVPRLRAAAPGLALFLTGGCYSSIEGAVLLDPALFRAERTFLSVHFYEPFLFTHQGSTWTLPYLAGVAGVPYPAEAGRMAETLAATRRRYAELGRDAGRRGRSLLREAEGAIARYFAGEGQASALNQRLDKLRAWQSAHGIDPARIVFTEFGAMKQTLRGAEIDAGSRGRWLQQVSGAIERNGWGWTIHVLRGDPFGLYRDEEDRDPDPRFLRALRLRSPEP